MNPEMGLAAGPGARMTRVLVGFIDDIQVYGRKGFRQFFRDTVSGGHGSRLAGLVCCGQCAAHVTIAVIQESQDLKVGAARLHNVRSCQSTRHSSIASGSSLSRTAVRGRARLAANGRVALPLPPIARPRGGSARMNTGASALSTCASTITRTISLPA